MKILLFCISLFLCLDTQIYSQTDEYLLECANERILDSTSVSFDTFEGSERFINKFLLSKDEMDMIGIWGFDGVICKIPSERKYGPGLSIKFYPNRYFRIYREGKDIGKIKGIFGEWRVVGKKLQVKFRAKLFINNIRGGDMYGVEYFDDDTYYTIFSLPVYEIAFVNTNPFDWGEVPSDILSFFDFANNDAPRSRLLLDPLGDPPGDLKEGAKLGDTLFYPCMTKKYLIELMDIW